MSTRNLPCRLKQLQIYLSSSRASTWLSSCRCFHGKQCPVLSMRCLNFLQLEVIMIHITEFMVLNGVIEFICNADLPLCNIFLFGHSCLKKNPKQNQRKNLNQQILLLWVKISIDILPLGITFGKGREHSLQLILRNEKLKPVGLKVIVNYFVCVCMLVLLYCLLRQTDKIHH